MKGSSHIICRRTFGSYSPSPYLPDQRFFPESGKKFFARVTIVGRYEVLLKYAETLDQKNI